MRHSDHPRRLVAGPRRLVAGPRRLVAGTRRRLAGQRLRPARRRLWLAACLACALALAVVTFARAETETGKQPRPVPPASGAGGFPALEALEKEVGKLVEASRPSVVGVVARSTVEALLRPMGPELKMTPVPAPREQLVRRVGSGLIIDTHGHVATLASVVAGASDVIVVPWDGRRLQARIRGTDPLSGLAVLQVDSAIELSPVAFADTTDVRVGSVVTTLGISQESSPVFSLGFVSGMGISQGPVRRSPYLKLDAWSTPGAAGGAVLDSKGQLVGMLFGAEEPRDRARDLLRWHTDRHAAPRDTKPPAEIEIERKQIEDSVSSALAALKRPGSEGSAVSYALPANIVRRVTREIIESGTARRGWLGVTVDDRGPGEIVVAEVASGSPAARAGLESGDRVIYVNGQPVEGSWTLMESVASAGPGDAMKIVVMRDGKQVPANVQLGTAPRQQYTGSQVGHTWVFTPSPPLPPRPVLGVRVEQPDDEELERLGAPAGAGMLIAEVHEESRAEVAGLLEGDLIIRALGIPVRSLADLRRALRDQPGDKQMEMVVVRDGREVKLMVPPPPPPPPTPPAPAQPATTPQPRRPPRP